MPAEHELRLMLVNTLRKVINRFGFTTMQGAIKYADSMLGPRVL